jgi:dephospho-CoA kinase
MGHVIGLLGGVASGKSTVASLLRKAGWLVLDADIVARDVVEQPEVAAALAKRFGNDVLAPDGSLYRAVLARRAFRDSASTEALNAIVHPAVRQQLGAELRSAGDRDVALDVPLLLGSPLAQHVQTWVFIETDEERRDTRSAARDWEPDERARREAQQASLAEKRARADHILENNGTIDDLGAQVDALLHAWAQTNT